MESRNVVHEKHSKNEQLMSRQALRKSHGSDKHCTEFCVVTCWKCIKKKKKSEIISLIKKNKKK
jgi:hypothetical protein